MPKNWLESAAWQKGIVCGAINLQTSAVEGSDV